MSMALQQIDLYRQWSAYAARQALLSGQPVARERCAHSAGAWTMIADALEAGDDRKVAMLTHNLTILRRQYMVPAV
jgi:hypothetical protein